MTESERPNIRVTDKRKVGADEVGADAPPSTEAETPPLDEATGDAEQIDVTDEVDDAEQPVEDVDELAQARAEAAVYLEDLKRLKAEFENYRKRMVREQTAMIERASQAVIERMLPILDNFELALLAADRTKDYEAMVRGVELVYGELLDVLHKEGLERIAALGQPFDPELHEAVMRAEGDDASHVVDEMRPGYKIAGRVVRPAMVKVGPRQEGSDEQ